MGSGLAPGSCPPPSGTQGELQGPGQPCGVRKGRCSGGVCSGAVYSSASRATNLHQGAVSQRPHPGPRPALASTWDVHWFRVVAVPTKAQGRGSCAGRPVDGAPGVSDPGDRPAVPTPGPGWGPFPPHPFLSLQRRPPLRGRLSCPLAPDGCGVLCPHPGQRCRREGSCPASEGRPALPWTREEPRTLGTSGPSRVQCQAHGPGGGRGRGERSRSNNCHSSSPAAPGPWRAFLHDWKLELSCWL